MRLALCISIAAVLWTGLVFELAGPFFHRGWRDRTAKRAARRTGGRDVE